MSLYIVAWETELESLHCIQSCQFVFLGSPNEQAVRLKRVWANNINTKPRWKIFINRLKDELGRYTVFVSLVRFVCRISYCSQSTVMLAVNVNFLAVPGVVTTGSAASPIGTIIYCSEVSALASILFSVILLNICSNPRLVGAHNVVCLHAGKLHNYLECSRQSLQVGAMWMLSQTKWSMACLAITCSLPNASLMWSYVISTHRRMQCIHALLTWF